MEREVAQRERTRFGSEGSLVRIQSSRPTFLTLLWCSGNTSDFLSDALGSTPGGSAKFQTKNPGGPTVRTPDFDSGSEGSIPSLGANSQLKKLMKTTILETERLLMRPLVREDAPLIQKYAGDRRIAEMTLSIPHPYPDGLAESWIEELRAKPSEGGPFALTLKEGGELVGLMALSIQDDKLQSEVGFWMVPLFWGHGLCTEALNAMIDYGFRKLNLMRIYGGHFSENPASGRVQRKAGMKEEGTHRMGAFRFGEPKDLVMHAIIRPDREARS